MSTVDNDELVIDEVEAAFRRAYRRYRQANAVEQLDLAEPLQKAATAWVDAQRSLVEAGQIATADQLAEIRRIRHAIDDARQTQEFVIALGRLTSFLIAFV